MPQIFRKLIEVSVSSIVFLNYFAGIIGAIWLLFLGEWRLVLGAIIFYFVSFWILSLLLLIPMPFSYLGIYLEKKNFIFLALIGLFMGLLLTSAISSGWVVTILSSIYSNQDNGINLIPLILGGYAIGTKPFLTMARGEDADSEGTFVTLYVVQITYVIGAILMLIGLEGLTIPIAIILILVADVYLLKKAYKLIKFNKTVVDEIG